MIDARDLDVDRIALTDHRRELAALADARLGDGSKQPHAPLLKQLRGQPLRRRRAGALHPAPVQHAVEQSCEGHADRDRGRNVRPGPSPFMHDKPCQPRAQQDNHERGPPQPAASIAARSLTPRVGGQESRHDRSASHGAANRTARLTCGLNRGVCRAAESCTSYKGFSGDRWWTAVALPRPKALLPRIWTSSAR